VSTAGPSGHVLTEDGSLQLDVAEFRSLAARCNLILS